jgi:hypothetical protein
MQEKVIHLDRCAAARRLFTPISAIMVVIFLSSLAHAASPLDRFTWPKEPNLLKPLDTTPANYQASFDYLESFPESAWTRSQRQLHGDFLGAKRYDVVVAPFQTRGYPFDQIARSLVTRYLVDAIESRYGTHLPHPDIVELATSRNDRALDIQSVYQLATAVNAKHLVLGYMGHDLKGKMSVVIEVVSPGTKGFNQQSPRTTANWDNLTFDDVRLPSEAFLAIRERVIDRLELDIHGKTKEKIRIGSEERNIDAIEKWSAQRDTPVLNAALRLQLLGTLAPVPDDRFREQLYERSLVALAKLKNKTPHVRWLKSRAFGALYRRPAALSLASPAGTASLRALRERLNGSLPNMAAEVVKIDSPTERLLTELDEHDLRAAYGESVDSKALDEKAKKYPAIEFLLNRRLHDSDPWYVQSNAVIKKELDRVFPIRDFSLESIVHAGMLQGKPVDQNDIDLSVEQHYRRMLKGNRAWAFYNSWQLNELDHLRLYYVFSEENLLDRANLRLKQGLPEKGLQELDALDIVYATEPRFLMCRARYLVDLLEKVDNQHAPGLRQRASVAVQQAFIANGGSEDGATAISGLRTLGDQIDTAHGKRIPQVWQEPAALSLYYEVQFPPRPYFTPARGPAGFMREPAIYQRMLDYSERHFYPFANLHKRFHSLATGSSGERYPGETEAQWKQREAGIRQAQAALKKLETELDSRFVGSPKRYGVLEARLQEADDEAGLVRHYRGAIEAESQDFGPYRNLGIIEILNGRFAEAEKVFWSYPPFRDHRKDDAVALSNYAYDAGSMLYWRGEFERARKLYALAVGYSTGSAAEMSSAERLAMMAGDYYQAVGHAQNRATRYNNDYAYRDFMSWLHAYGYSSDAWVLFDSVLPTQQSTEIWNSAFVGHRINAASDKTIVDWVKGRVDRGDVTNADRKGARYLFQALAIDRPVNPKLVDYIAALDNKTQDRNHDADRLLPSVREMEIFVRAYHYIKQKKYKDAMATFYGVNAMLLPRNSTPNAFMFPYITYAGIKAGKISYIDVLHKTYGETSRLGKNDRNWQSQLFYRDIALAFAATAQKDHARATDMLERAFRRRPHTGSATQFTWYQIVEAAEWMYADTGYARFRELALRWARAYQRVFPMYGWAYAVEATLTTDPVARNRAIALAEYLDPQSDRLGRIDDASRRAAAKWLKTHNPFQAPKQVGAGEA